MQSDPGAIEAGAFVEMLIDGVDGGARMALLEAMLGHLLRSDGSAAKLVAATLLADADPCVAAIGRAFLDADPVAAGLLDVRSMTQVDLLLMAIKPVELEACLQMLDIGDSASFELISGTGALLWRTTYGGLSIAIAMVGVAGNTRSASVTTQLLDLLKPRFAALVGMAAGNSELGVKIGDVVVSEAVIEYEFKKITDEGVFYSPQPYPATAEAASGAEVSGRITPAQVQTLRALTKIGAPMSGGPIPEPDAVESWNPHVRLGVIFAGATLVENASFPELASEVHGRGKAMEMEGAGFAQASTAARVPWLVIRGIADHGTPERAKEWQYPASLAAACVIRNLIDARVIPGAPQPSRSR